MADRANDPKPHPDRFNNSRLEREFGFILELIDIAKFVERE
tara:strand:+ start:444 stop:566 length:123 start_codon:yes stop_codon:yes gene_type:complete